MNQRNKKIIAREFLILCSCSACAVLVFLLTFLYNLYFDIRYRGIEKKIDDNIELISFLNDTLFRMESQDDFLHPVDSLILSEHNKVKLEAIVDKLISNDESHANIQTVANEFKYKYGTPIKSNPASISSVPENNTALFTDIRPNPKATTEDTLFFTNIKGDKDFITDIRPNPKATTGDTLFFTNIKGDKDFITDIRPNPKATTGDKDFITDIRINPAWVEAKVDTAISKELGIKQTKLMSREMTMESILSLEQQLRISFYSLLILLAFLFPIRYLYYSVKWSIKVVKAK